MHKLLPGEISQMKFVTRMVGERAEGDDDNDTD